MHYVNYVSDIIRRRPPYSFSQFPIVCLMSKMQSPRRDIGRIKLSRAHYMLSRAKEKPSRAHEIVSREHYR